MTTLRCLENLSNMFFEITQGYQHMKSHMEVFLTGAVSKDTKGIDL